MISMGIYRYSIANEAAAGCRLDGETSMKAGDFMNGRARGPNCREGSGWRGRNTKDQGEPIPAWADAAFT